MRLKSVNLSCISTLLFLLFSTVVVSQSPKDNFLEGEWKGKRNDKYSYRINIHWSADLNMYAAVINRQTDNYQKVTRYALAQFEGEELFIKEFGSPTSSDDFVNFRVRFENSDKPILHFSRGGKMLNLKYKGVSKQLEVEAMVEELKKVKVKITGVNCSNCERTFKEGEETPIRLTMFNESSIKTIGGLKPTIDISGSDKQYFIVEKYRNFQYMEDNVYSKRPFDIDCVIETLEGVEIDEAIVVTGLKIGSYKLPIEERETLPIKRMVEELSKGINVDNPRHKLLIDYFGYRQDDLTYDISEGLESLIDYGDDKAKAWKSLFSYLGTAGFNENEYLAKYIIRKDDLFENLGKEGMENGDSESLFLLASCVLFDLIPSQLDVSAERLLEMSGDGGFHMAYHMLSIFYLSQNKVNSAYFFLEKALENEVLLANFTLALMHERGLSKYEKDVTKSKELLQQLSSKGNPSATLKLATQKFDESTSLAEKEQAITMLKVPSSLSHPKSLLVLANMLLDVGMDEHWKEAFQLKLKAAELGYPDAMCDMGIYYYASLDESVRDKKKGKELLLESAVYGNAYAMHLMGEMYLNDNMSPYEEHMARYWFNLASRKGVGRGVQNKITSTSPLKQFASAAFDFETTWADYMTDKFMNKVFGDDVMSFEGHMFWNGVANVVHESLKQRQVFINEVFEIYECEQFSVYGGIMSSQLEIPRPEKNSYYDFSASGTMSVGNLMSEFEGECGPSGFKNGVNKLNSVYTDYNHGALLLQDYGRINNVGYGADLAVSSNDAYPLFLLVNDKHYKNNMGYYDFSIVAYKQ